MKTNILLHRKALLLCAFLFGIFGVSWGQIIGIYQSYIILELNSSGSAWYDLNANTANQDFHNSNLGDYVIGTNTLVLKGGQNKTFKCNGGNVTGCNLYYRIYKTSSTPPSFNSLSFSWASNDVGGCGGNQSWQSVGNSINILNGLSAGTYFLEVYSDAQGWPNTVFANNSSSNYKATFRIASRTAQTGNWSNNSTWTDNVVPNSSDFVSIQHDITLESSQAASVADIAITASKSLLLATNSSLTLTGILNNSGTFTLENGATFKQGASVSGGGTYNIKQNLDNCSNNGTSLTGRFWYLGSPVTSLRENSFGNTGNLNKVWSFTNGAYNAIADGATLSPTTGYVHRRGTNASPLTFTGTNLYATDETIQLSNNAGTYGGWHLIANPYTAYLDWQQVYNASNALSSAISPSYYIRSFNSTGNDVNALITYNSSTGLESNTSSFSLGSPGSTIARYIAPMQAFWVKVNPTTPLSATAGQLRLERAFTSHQTGNVGLKSSTIFPTLARVNLVDGARYDQMLVFMNQDMSNGVDQFDSEKMFVSGAPQIYTMAAGKKLVMNGLNSNKKKISVPLYLELPQSKVYQLQLADYNLEDGLILLEDKQEGTIQDFTIHDTYAFYANSGIVQNRFILHFFMPDATITAQGPSNSWVAEEGSYTEGGNVQITADSKGKVQISLDQPETDKVEGSVQVTDANGRIVHSGALEGLTTLFELNVPSGIYYLTVQSGNLIENKKLFIQE